MTQAPHVEGMYDPEEFKHLDVSLEIRWNRTGYTVYTGRAGNTGRTKNTIKTVKTRRK